MSIQQLEPQLSSLSRAEKAELVQRLVREIVNAWPGIEKIDNVAGGEACIVRTRIPVWTLENSGVWAGVKRRFWKTILL